MFLFPKYDVLLSLEHNLNTFHFLRLRQVREFPRIRIYSKAV